MSEWINIEDLIAEHIRKGGWRARWELFKARVRIKWMLWRGWRPAVQTLCCQCIHPIHEEDDEACVCINCGGRNRRILSA
jgi:hypothetical protein